MSMTKHTISVLVNNQPGVLQRVSGLFGRRGFNIDSITVGESEESGLSRMVIVTTGDERTLEQVQKQLYKLIDVIKVIDLRLTPTESTWKTRSGVITLSGLYFCSWLFLA